MDDTDVLTQDQIERIRGLSSEGRLDCAQAFKLAEEFGIPKKQMGKVLDDLGIRVRNCQLGCF